MPRLHRLTLAVALASAPLSAPTLADELLETLTVTASAATKTETPFLETPQAISMVEREEWEVRGAESVQRAADYTPGVFTNQIGASNRYDYLVLRGFADGSINNTFLDGLKVMSDGGSFSSLVIDPWFLERIEVVKGPASVLYGRASPGGLVAQTSRRPEFESGGELRLRLGNNAQRSAAFDVTGPLDAERRLAFRLTGLARAADTQFGPAEEERYAIAPQLSWDINDATSLTLHAYLQRDPKGGYHAGLPFEGTVVDRNGRRIANNFFEGEEAYDKFERDQVIVGYELEHRFNDALSARQRLRYTETEVELAQVYAFGWASATELNRFFSGGDESLEALTVDNQLEARLATGDVEHTLLLGLDHQRRNNDVTWTSGAFPAIDAFNPQYGAGPSMMFPEVLQRRELEQTGLYLQDQLAFGNWHANLGLRHDWVEITNRDPESGAESALDDTQISGRAGLLYRFDNGLAPYASYSTSFSPNSTTDQNGDLLAPTEGEQVELGLKYQPPGSRDRYSLALFDITQENVSAKRPNETFYRATGEIRSRGLELEAHHQLSEALSLQAAYGYTDVTLERTGDANEGNRSNQVPRHQLAVWGNYAVQNGALAGLDAGLGVRYHADIYADDANTEMLPDTTLVEATLGYDLARLGLDSMSARLNVSNLLDEAYVASCYDLNFCYFGAERSATASLHFAF
ncbi:TonB-dependent siderophore receptor [Halomonas campisalis]|uniref:TonB-dependent siderophore receptor n=1 Tax=Billgrantia campisalis TaxID=74661 RepID=A0ABS9P977_9GAMM|nr:TonB-dependent siderophore receptor [Halomonas campisalis]MCG6657772.1 TonB-dependent siderophore receptor [Halomonas campisalis]MDR5862456.1 TonB-dependent siderophore receptor [Halomonas campisalis]